MLIRELREAVSLDLTDPHLDYSKFPIMEDGRLIQCCGNLAVLNRKDNTVRLAHHTVRQFLLGDNTWQNPMSHMDIGTLASPSLTESLVGGLCVTYLCFSNFERQITREHRATMSVETDFLETAVYSHRPVSTSIAKLARTFGSGWTETELSRQSMTIEMGASRTRHDIQQTSPLLQYMMQHRTSHAASIPTTSHTWPKLRSFVFNLPDIFRGHTRCFQELHIRSPSRVSGRGYACHQGYARALPSCRILTRYCHRVGGV